VGHTVDFEDINPDPQVNPWASPYSGGARLNLTPANEDSSMRLKTFPNPCTGSDYQVRFHFSSFRSICPETQKGDVGCLDITYTPGHVCVEGFSLSGLVRSFAKKEAFHEQILNEVFSLLAESLNPKALRVRMTFPLFSQLEGEPAEVTLERAS
jgi:NADPH-dependent 7-cyano-7-deazaguanine reductase QueF